MSERVVRTMWDRKSVVTPSRMKGSEKDRARVATQQQFKKESDINTIVAKAKISGFLPPETRMKIYEDLSEMPESLEQAHDLIARAQDSFMQLPALVRLELDNDPAQFEHMPVDWYRRHGFLPAEEQEPVRAPVAGSKGGTPSDPPKGDESSGSKK